ncbi:hypothetical protein QZH41_000066 [Actinostola sp. cb2023]|nr:hypothetical protein QZH41_000066 [Actinostola sp. cb2023]
MTKVRSKYWIPRLRRLVKRVRGNCHGCKRYQAMAYAAPPPANLPTTRTQGVNPYQVIGVDYAGPLRLRYNHGLWIIDIFDNGVKFTGNSLKLSLGEARSRHGMTVAQADKYDDSKDFEIIGIRLKVLERERCLVIVDCLAQAQNQYDGSSLYPFLLLILLLLLSSTPSFPSAFCSSDSH